MSHKKQLPEWERNLYWITCTKKVTQLVKVLAPKPGDPNFMYPWNVYNWTNSCKFSSDFHLYAMAQVYCLILLIKCSKIYYCSFIEHNLKVTPNDILPHQCLTQLWPEKMSSEVDGDNTERPTNGQWAKN